MEKLCLVTNKSVYLLGISYIANKIGLFSKRIKLNYCYLVK